VTKRAKCQYHMCDGSGWRIPGWHLYRPCYCEAGRANRDAERAEAQARTEGPLVQVGERIARQALAAMDADLDAQTKPLVDPERLAYARSLYRSSHEAVNQ